MSSQPEARLSRNIMRDLRAHGFFCFKVHGGPTMMAGLPDIIVCANGVFVGLEVKMPSEREETSPRQRYVHKLIKKSHGIAVVVCSPHEALDIATRASHLIPNRMAARTRI